MKAKLDAIIEFQKLNPNAHVGGSIGLMLRGINLHRDLTASDLDITVDEYQLQEKEGFEEYQLQEKEGFEESSNVSDFDHVLLRRDGGLYTRIDVRISPEPTFDAIEFEGQFYNVSKLRDILWWKQKYANKGIRKHMDDLETIRTGIRPKAVVLVASFGDNDLPF